MEYVFIVSERINVDNGPYSYGSDYRVCVKNDCFAFSTEADVLNYIREQKDKKLTYVRLKVQNANQNWAAQLLTIN